MIRFVCGLFAVASLASLVLLMVRVWVGEPRFDGLSLLSAVLVIGFGVSYFAKEGA